MELQFTKSGSVYVAEATVNKPYNLHLERPYPTYEHGSGELEGLLASDEWKGVADG